MEKYSVLMSVYIKEKPEHLKQSINSMINQTVMPDEIVIVKDGPLTDELIQILNDYDTRYPGMFHYYENAINRGLGISLNNGLSICRNELIARMDTDDISMPDRCEKQLKAFRKNPNLSIISGRIDEFINTPDNIVGSRIVPSTHAENMEYLKKRCPINHVAAMFKKSAVLEAGGYIDWFWNEDYYLWIRMAEHGCIFENIQDSLVLVRVGVEMYRRRGGKKYFDSEVGLQKYMLQKKLIGPGTYFMNVMTRLIVQRMMPNWLRGWVFRKFARS